MTRTFLVTLEAEPGTDLNMEADLIHDALERDGFPVLTVRPWAGATTVPVASPPPSPTLITPPPTPVLPGVSSTPLT